MIANLMMMGSRYLSSFRSQRGAVAWEYILIVAVVSVGIVGAMVGPANGLTTKVLDAACLAIVDVIGFGACV